MPAGNGIRRAGPARDDGFAFKMLIGEKMGKMNAVLRSCDRLAFRIGAIHSILMDSGVFGGKMHVLAAFWLLSELG